MNLVDLINDEKDSEDKDSKGKGDDLKTGISDLNTEAEIRNYWKQAINDSKLILRVLQKNLCQNHLKEIWRGLEPEIDWKTKLWNF